jgi:hypothetical protein
MLPEAASTTRVITGGSVKAHVVVWAWLKEIETNSSERADLISEL